MDSRLISKPIHARWLIFNEVFYRSHRRYSMTLAHVFSCEFCKIFKSTLFTEHLWATASEFNTHIQNSFQYPEQYPVFSTTVQLLYQNVDRTVILNLQYDLASLQGFECNTY